MENAGRWSMSVLLADGDAGERARLAALLDSGGFEPVEASRGDEAVALARDRRPALAILEIPLRVLSGYEVCRVLKAELGTLFPIAFLSGHRTESYDRVAGLLLGADDYLVKPYAPDELLARVRLLAARARVAEPPERRTTLTPREEEVLALLADGMRQVEIAAQLGISSRTVGTHIEHVLHKLGVHSRAQAVALAMRNGIHLASPDAKTEAVRGSRRAVY